MTLVFSNRKKLISSEFWFSCKPISGDLQIYLIIDIAIYLLTFLSLLKIIIIAVIILSNFFKRHKETVFIFCSTGFLEHLRERVNHINNNIHKKILHNKSASRHVHKISPLFTYLFYFLFILSLMLRITEQILFTIKK